MKVIRGENVAGHDDSAVDVLRLLVEGGLRSLAQLRSDTRHWTVGQVTATA
jgi:hypothetical protein